MTTKASSLVEILAEIPDPRKALGRRYPLVAMLTLVCVGLLCGYRSIYAISEWGANYGATYLERLGFNEHGYPAQATWYRVLRLIDVDVVEEKVRKWLEALLKTKEGQLLGLSIDGKTLRISQKMGAKGSHLLSAVIHGLGVTVGQWPVDEHTNEIGMMNTVLLDLALEGRVVTTDALLTQKDVTETIIDRGGDYILPIKGNQPETEAILSEWFDTPPAPYEPPNQCARTIDKGHGRLTTRSIQTNTALNDYLNWPGLAQTFKLTRRRVSLKTGTVETETIYGLTSLSPERATPLDLLTFIQLHWTIENKLHWVKDVTMDEDHCQLRTGRTHQLMALFRNLTLSLLRLRSDRAIASSFRSLAAQPHLAIDLVSYPPGE